jgi:hypothetical protein
MYLYYCLILSLFELDFQPLTFLIRFCRLLTIKKNTKEKRCLFPEKKKFFKTVLTVQNSGYSMRLLF